MPSPLLDPQNERERDSEYIQQIGEAIHNRLQQGMFTDKAHADKVCELSHLLCRKITKHYATYGKAAANRMTVERMTLEGGDLLNSVGWEEKVKA